jgi:predicted nucleic acid-binding protein
MNGTRFVFDTCAAILLLKKDKRMFSLQQDLTDAQRYISVINRMELRAKPNITKEELKEIEVFLEYATVIPLTETIEEAAVEIRRATKLKLPDCIVAATSIVLGATLLTDDAQLKNLVWPGYSVQAI